MLKSDLTPLVKRTYRSNLLRILPLVLSIGILSLWSSVEAQEIIISEFLAINNSEPRDDLGNRSDWIELLNQSPRSINLRNWSLENGDFPRIQWTFPAVTIQSGQRLIVYASGQNRTDPTAPLHTNFQLSGQGEYLALLDSSGEIASEFSPAYPPQTPDVSYALNQSPGEGVTILDYGATARAHIPQNNDLGTSWRNVDFDDSSWIRGTTGVGYDYSGLIGLNVSAMRGDTESVYVRIPFTLDEVPDFNALSMSIQYEDGMVAFLNGTQIVSRNAPSSLNFRSGAPTNRPDAIAVTPEIINISQARSLLREGKNVLAFHGLNNLVTSSDLLLRPRITGFVGEANNNFGFAYPPTPREPNIRVVPGIGSEVVFSKKGGTYSSNFTLEITPASASSEDEVQIRYTTDGSIPDRNSQLYTTSIPVTSTVTIRSRTFGPGSLVGPVRTEHYLRILSSARNFSSNLPVIVMDTDGRSSIPASGWVSTQMHIFEPDTNGRTSLVSEPTYSSRAGIRVRGSSTAGRPKPSLNLELWGEVDEEDKQASLLGMPSESDWVLWGPYNFDPTFMRNPLVYELSNEVGRYAVRTKFVEVYLNRDGDNLESGDYFGVYVLMEKISRDNDRVDVERLFPEHSGTPGITGGYIFKIDRADPGDSGFGVPGATLRYVEPKEEEMEAPERRAQREWIQDFFGDLTSSLRNRRRPVPTYHDFLDVDAAIDHHLINVLAFNVDALRLSTYMHIPRNGKLTFGPIWDFDRSQGSTDGRDRNPEVWRGQSGDRGTDFFNYPWWRDLFRDLEFYQAYIDRWQELNDDTLSIAHIHSVIDRMKQDLSEAAPRNESRWGRFGSGFNIEVNGMKSWYTRRVRFMNSQFVDRPIFQTNTGIVEPGASVELTSPDGGDIYYTVDGSDPRSIGGSIASTALKYSEPIVVNESLNIRARVFKNSHTAQTGANNPPLLSKWSGVKTAAYSIDRAPLPGEIIISEIYYHPTEPTPPELSIVKNFVEGDFEYIEITNTTSDAIDLTTLNLTEGIEFNFSKASRASIEPEESLYVVNNREAFLARFGNDLNLLVLGEFSKNLSNGGELIRLVTDPSTIIFEVDYSDNWYPLTDGVGFSLVYTGLHNQASQSEAELWRPLGRIGTSPNDPDPASITLPGIVVNEVLLHSDPPLVDSVEIRNLDTNSINISGWFISDDLRQPLKYKIPNGTVLDTGDFLIIDESQFNNPESGTESQFSLSALGDEVFLFQTYESTDVLTGHYTGNSFRGSKSGESFGRYETSDGRFVYAPTSELSLGQPNPTYRIGPLIVTEVMYNPPSQDGQANTDDEFIEITNTSNQIVPLFLSEFPQITWRIRGGIDFDFPQNISVSPNESIIVTAFNPATESEKLQSFKSLFSIPETVQIFGPFQGNLNNRSDSIIVEAPEEPQPEESPEAGAIPYFTSDNVQYTSTSPWPLEADGLGASLVRAALIALGQDPSSWNAGQPSPGIHETISIPEITQVRVENGLLKLTFERKPGFIHAIYFTSSLTNPVWTLVTSYPSTNEVSVQTFEDNLEDEDSGLSGFYTIRLEAP